MKFATTIALTLVLGLGTTSALAQIGGMPTGGMPGGGMANMTPEQAQAMAEQMMLQLGGQLGLDPELLRDATKEERDELLDRASEARRGQSIQQMEQNLGMSLDQFETLSEDEKNALVMGMLNMPGPKAPEPNMVDLLPLHFVPSRGFPDGSVPLPVADDYSTELVVTEPVGRELLLVVADMSRREIVWREKRTAPFKEHLNLLDIAPDPSALILELIDPDTHVVIRRYRPVAAASE